MNYKQHIENALDYIESNLTAKPNLADIAKAAGYSEYHFLRVFKEVTSITPADYIRKRTLSEIAREMMQSDRPISEIAFEYGYNSKENFTRAFKTEHHVLPTEYKKSGNSLKLYGRMQLQVPSFAEFYGKGALNPDIVSIAGFTLVGYESDEEYPPNFWNKYNCKKLSLRLSGGKTVEDYGVSIPRKSGGIDYFIGIRSDDADDVPSEASELPIAGGLYAVFTTPPASHFDFVNVIQKTWDYISHTWFARNGESVRRLGQCEFETYTESSRTFSEKIYIPIEKI